MQTERGRAGSRRALKWGTSIVKNSELLGLVGQVLPKGGNLIRTILEHGGAGEFAGSVVVDESGVHTVSLRTIVRAMEVLNDFSKSTRFSEAAGSRELHAYYVVERAVNGEFFGPGRDDRVLTSGSSSHSDAGDL